jgi:hypothetical protein
LDCRPCEINEKAREFAGQNMSKLHQTNKTNYNRKSKASDIEVGNKVYKRQFLVGRNKIGDSYGRNQYRIVAKHNNGTFFIQNCNALDKISIVHRNLLTLCPNEGVYRRNCNSYIPSSATETDNVSEISDAYSSSDSDTYIVALESRDNENSHRELDADVIEREDDNVVDNGSINSDNDFDVENRVENRN